jgi:hypothetical protein
MNTVVLPTEDAAVERAATASPQFPAEVPACRLELSEEGFCTWLGTALPGDAIEYHRGHLAVDRDPVRSRLPETDRRRLSRLARRALIFAEERRAHLVQRRHGEGDYSYLAIKATDPAKRRR